MQSAECVLKSEEVEGAKSREMSSDHRKPSLTDSAAGNRM